MGFDVYCISELPIRNEDVEKAKQLVEQYCADYPNEEYRPGIKLYEHHELVMYDISHAESDEDEVIGHLHNETLYELIDPVLKFLKDNGVYITGWIHQNFDDGEVCTTFFKDSEELGYLNDLGLSRMCLKYIMNDGAKIDFKLVNKPFWSEDHGSDS